MILTAYEGHYNDMQTEMELELCGVQTSSPSRYLT